jgi:hypothetical protein
MGHVVWGSGFTNHMNMRHKTIISLGLPHMSALGVTSNTRLTNAEVPSRIALLIPRKEMPCFPWGSAFNFALDQKPVKQSSSFYWGERRKLFLFTTRNHRDEAELWLT